MATNQKATLKKLMQPKTSGEAETYLDELSSMLESTREEFDALLSTKDDVLSTLDDEKIDRYFDQERELDKQIQVTEVSENRLKITLEELKVKEGKSSAEPIRKKGIQAQQRGVEIYKEYTEHAKAIKALIDELKDADTQVRQANRECSELDDDHVEINLPIREVSRVFDIFSPVDLLKKSPKVAMRLPIIESYGKYYVNNLDLSRMR